MSRIDVQTLVLAFQKRIEALEKNPPDKVSTAVIINMLEKSIDEIINDHFLVIVKKDIKKQVTQDFKDMHHDYINKVINNIFRDDDFRVNLEKSLKKQMLSGIDNE